MKSIPISAARRIAEDYGYDQVVIVARKVDGGEHCTTYGVNKAIGEVSPTNADDVTCLRCLYLLGRYVPLVKLREHQAAEHYRAEAGK